MKLTLFTISNEQIKETLSKLQTKVESLETVKEVQDKIISSKDSQITFLQGEISSITSWVIGGAGLVITLASVAFIFIKLLENKAKKKIEEAENTLQLATEKLAEIESAKLQTEINLTESDSKIAQLNSLIDKSNNIATIAQEKIEELEVKQKELTELTTTLSINQKSDVILKNINFTLDFIKHAIDDINNRFSTTYFKPDHDTLMDFSLLCREYDTFTAKHMKLEMDLTKLIQTEQKISEVNIQNIENLKTEVEQFNLKLASFMDQLHDNKTANS